MAATSFDLADRLQTPVIMLMSDLDLGMNDMSAAAGVGRHVVTTAARC
jgi:hypothetical protein